MLKCLDYHTMMNVEEILEESRDWLLKAEEMQGQLNDYDTLRYFNHFKGVRELGYDLALKSPDNRHYHLSLVQSGKTVKTIRYER